MSQSMMRKAQPFTIGTRLSTPKCPDLPTCGPGAEALDGASMSQNLSDRVSHYLAQANSSPCRFSPPQRRAVYSAGSMDDNNSSLARSIKKITLSRHKDATYREGTMRLSPRVLAKNSHGNFNNNNSRGLRHFSPDAIEIPCDWSVRNPWSVSTVECNAPATTYAKCPGILHDSTQGNSVKTAPTSGNVPTTRRPSLETDSAIAQLSLDIKQAEIWVRGKLQDLSDQCDIFPLQDWDRRALSIQGDISDFESTIMKLSQMGERLSRSQTSNAASIRTQLQALKDQWQLLKLTATNQNRAAGGAKALLEFNKKADELEIWMREKEENPPLSVLLDENFDKMQLTRRILDLKQDQLYYRNLQENINGLAQKLEKQGRAESKGTSNRRKHLNRMWLRLQTSLEEHHQSLQLALEAATLWQQADAILRAMEEKRSSATVRNGGCGDQDLRDIASQIMVLDITVSQVCSLHPVLASKALHKQRRVKESWTQLQQTVRKERSSRVTFTREPGSSVTTVSEDQSSVGNQAQRILGCQEAETNNRDYNIQNPLNSPPEAQTEKEIICVIPLESKRQDSSLTDREQTQGPHNGLLQRPPSSSKTEADHLLNELSSTTQWLQSVELLLSEPTAMRSPELVRRDLRQVSILEKEVKSRGPALHCLGGKARRLRVPDWTVSEETQVKVLEVEERFQIVQEALQRRASDLRDTLVLSEFMKVVQMEEERKKKEMPADGGSGRGEYGSCCVASGRTERFTPLEDLQEAVEMLNDAVKERERAVAASKEMTDLESRLLALSKMIASVRSRLQDVGRQVEAAEQGFTAVKKQTDLRDVQEMFIQQQQIEMDMFGAISEELRKLDEGRGRLQELCPTRSETVDSSIEEILQACSHLQGRIQENEARLQRTARLREFFLSYLGMISWTEDMRSQVLSESPGDRLVPGRREELEKSIEEKLKEFEVLAGIGWKLIGEDHRLSQMIKERLEELQGMLSWVLMRWRCQKQQRGNKAQRLKTTDVLEATKVPKVTWKLDFQLMEGPLEKKPILQPGGKKASCRTWGVFYAVLVRRTLCFYHDRKHSTKSFVSSTPLNLTGAVCTQESDYAKRSNCFRLRLKDGSEYLFRAPTSELLQEWVSKVCHNSGLEDTDLLGNSVLGTNLTPCHVSRDDPLSPWKTNLCRPIPVQGRDMVDQPRQKEPQNVQADDCRSRTGPQLPSRFYVPENIGPEHDSNLTTYRRRSQSFSSVMYQKVTSFTNPQEISPSYSVTLYIDEPLTPRGRCHSFATSHREGHTSHTADLKPRNKSVFRKFFRKKE
ncbi:spectrin beta chain, non-erythrocytic 5-like isoform X3 [Pseudophryne corroboree]|uniref:spectrin beta chain, non-erythrocytic 5-like isoform X3 n=1 Tax=Pseudophryne corroboree TaxID=495146 RepID=UPI003081C56B